MSASTNHTTYTFYVLLFPYFLVITKIMAMSMRSRAAAAAAARRPRPAVQPVYEDFKPKTESKHEEEADTLLYHLPGFVKEQIRIIAESKGILRVRGERLLADNKWSRFQEEVIVPEDCKLNEIRAKFEDGILKIIMPRNIKIGTTPKQPITGKDASKLLPEPLPTNPKHSSINQKPQLPTEKLASSSTPHNNIEKPQNTPLESVRESHPTTLLHDHTKEVGHDEMSKNVNNKNNETTKIKHDGDKLKVKEKHKVIGNVGNIENKHNGNHGLIPNMKNMRKGHAIRKLDEDRQLLVNMGAAILVIMSLGASISYSLGSN